MPLTKDHFTSMRAKDVMTRDVIAVYANQQLSTATEKLLEHHITGAPVVSYDEVCVGVLSSKDILRREATDSQNDTVLSHMTTPAMTVSQDHSLLEVAAMLHSNAIHRVPVVDDLGQVVGILSTLDIVGQVLKAMAPDTTELQTTTSTNTKETP
ncbi:MAG: CBS domain-containing protein [Candidatus Nealsonbacteria bacterium]|nr:CBS domain-containing protein [Candidatus Nealsonbacteria bacterium]